MKFRRDNGEISYFPVTYRARSDPLHFDFRNGLSRISFIAPPPNHTRTQTPPLRTY